MVQVVQNLRMPELHDQECTLIFTAYDITVANHAHPPSQAAVLPGTPAFRDVLHGCSLWT